MFYFDNGATSWPKPPQVLESMEYYLKEVGGSPGRSGHRLSAEAGRLIFTTRELAAELFNISDPQQIAFTKNITECLNYCLLTQLASGDHVITTSMEHNSVMRPLRYLEGKGVEVTVVPCDVLGHCLPQDIENAIKANTKMIVVNHASNVIGTIQPLEAIGSIAQKYNCVFVVDAAQSAGAISIDVEKMQIDVLGFTGHKSLLGPQGTGGIYFNPAINIKPLIFGGTGSNSEFETQPSYMPDVLESGTINAVGLAGLGAGIRFILDKGIENIKEHEQGLTQYFIDILHNFPGIKLYGPEDAKKRTAVVSLNIENTVCSEVGTVLDQVFDIMTRTGLHCAPSAHKTIGTFPQGTVRFSFGIFNTMDEVKNTVEIIKELAIKSQEL